MSDDTTKPPPDPVAAYLAAIGARGGRANSPAQEAARARGRAARRLLDDEQRAEIVRRAASEKATALAAEYGVSKDLIYKIWRAAKKAAKAAEEAGNDTQ